MSDSKVSVAQMQGFLLANTESLVDKARRNKQYVDAGTWRLLSCEPDTCVNRAAWANQETK